MFSIFTGVGTSMCAVYNVIHLTYFDIEILHSKSAISIKKCIILIVVYSHTYLQY